jgi:hypothetical protein
MDQSPYFKDPRPWQFIVYVHATRRRCTNLVKPLGNLKKNNNNKSRIMKKNETYVKFIFE